MISGFLQRGSDLGLGRSFCNFARDGRGVRSDSGTCWDTFLETGIQVGLSSELVLLRQVDQRLRSAYWCYDHLLQNRGDAWSRIFHWHTLRAGFVRAVAYLAERCAVTKIMKDVPGFVVTTSMLGKLLGGESREIPCRTERDFGSLRQWTRRLRSRPGSLIWVDEQQAESVPLLAPWLLHFDACLLLGGES